VSPNPHIVCRFGLERMRKVYLLLLDYELVMRCAVWTVCVVVCCCVLCVVCCCVLLCVVVCCCVLLCVVACCCVLLCVVVCCCVLLCVVKFSISKQKNKNKINNFCNINKTTWISTTGYLNSFFDI
jgi:hypothetical protein